MKRVVVVQARMTSTRLPGKVLRDVCGQPMLAQQLRRLKRCQQVDQIVVATTTNGDDDPLVELALREDVGWFRGSEQDVLQRFVGAARQANADVVVRITADCPLIDAQVTDRVIAELLEHSDECDYASNVIQRTYPRGLDVEAFFWDTLLRFDRMAQSKPSREHVTVLARSERPDLFVMHSVEDAQNNADLRWTVDTAADLEMIRAIYSGLNLAENLAAYAETLSFVRAHPQISQMNANIETWDPQRQKH